MEQETLIKDESKTFAQRLDFYWQYIAVYAIILVVYSLMKGTITEGTLTLVIYDPFVILLLVFIVASSIPMLINYYKGKSITIGKDFIAFTSRFREKRYDLSSIINISFGSEKLAKVRRGTYRIIKIKILNRRRAIKVRPGSYWDDKELVKALSKLKKALNK